jgi:chromosome segregation ATPase
LRICIIMPRRQRRVHRARHRRRSASVDTSDSMSTSSSVDSSTNASAIEEITNAITKRAAEISTMVQRRMSLRTSCHGNDDVSDTETERPSHPQEDIGIGTYLSQLKSTVLSKNDQESDERHGMKQILRELRMTQLELKDQELKTTMQIAKMAKMESLEKIQREEIKEVKETIKQKNIMISSLKQEKEELTEKTHMLEKTVKSLTEEISRYEAIVRNSKVLAENQCSLISENEKSIRCLEEKNTELWKKWSNDVSTMKCKDALLNMQRQQMEEQENLLKIYETKFLAKGVDVVKGKFFTDFIICRRY